MCAAGLASPATPILLRFLSLSSVVTLQALALSPCCFSSLSSCLAAADGPAEMEPLLQTLRTQ